MSMRFDPLGVVISDSVILNILLLSLIFFSIYGVWGK